MVYNGAKEVEIVRLKGKTVIEDHRLKRILTIFLFYFRQIDEYPESAVILRESVAEDIV